MDFSGVKSITIPEGSVKKITANGVTLWEKISYTNLIPLAVGSDGKPYNNGQGWKTGYRLNSSGVETAANLIEVTGFMPCEKTDFLYFANMTFAKTGDGKDYTYIATYDSNKNKLTSSKVSSLAASVTEWDSKGNLVRLDMEKYIYLNNSSWQPKFFRISGYDINSNSIITRNQPIE